MIKKKANAREIKLNLGCGDDYKENYINIDVNKRVKADIYCDFAKKLPFKNNSVNEVYCKNVFEHVPNPLNFLLEIKRVLKKSGKALIITSNASYFIYHFPRRKGHHDFYNETHTEEDRHYFMFQRGHLIAFTKKAGLKLKRLDYWIANQGGGRDYHFQKLVGSIVGKKFGYSDFIWEVEK